MATDTNENEEPKIGKNSKEALAFLAALDPSNFPSTTTIETIPEIKIPGYILEYFLDFIRQLYVKAKKDTEDEAPLTSGLPLSPIEEKLNTLLKGLEERDDDYFAKVPFPLTTIRAEKDLLSVAGEMPLPELLQELFLAVASQFVEQTSLPLTQDISFESVTSKSSSTTSSTSSVPVSSDSSAELIDTVTSVALEYTRPKLERLRKIICACISKSEAGTKTASTSSSSVASQISVIELMTTASTEESSAPRSSKPSSTAGSISSQASVSRSSPETQTSPVAVLEKAKSTVATVSEKESSSSLVKVKMLTTEPKIPDMSPTEMNKFAVEIYMTRFYSLAHGKESDVMPYVEKLLGASWVDSGIDFSGLKGVKTKTEEETIDIYKFSNNQVKALRSRAKKNFQLMIKAKHNRDLKCLKRIKDSGKVVSLRAI